MNNIKKLFMDPGGRAAAWIFLFLLLILFSSCSPYEPLPTATATTSPARPAVTPARTPVLIRTPTALPTCTVRTGMPAGTVNLRTGAGVSHGVMRVLREGTVLKVLERADWLKVIDARGRTGFIYGRYCQ